MGLAPLAGAAWCHVDLDEEKEKLELRELEEWLLTPSSPLPDRSTVASAAAAVYTTVQQP